jgi:hypothetical protein
VPGLLYSAKRTIEKRNAAFASLEATAFDLLKRESYPRLWSIPLINIETRIREAKFIIRLGRWLQRIPEIMSNVLGAALWFIPSLLAFFLLIPSFLLGPAALDSGAYVFGYVATTGMLFLMVLYVPAIALLWLYGQIVIGGRPWRKSFYIDTQVGFLPDEAWGELRVREVRGKLQLRHSLIHEDESVVAEVSQFVRDCVRDRIHVTVVERKRGGILGIG